MANLLISSLHALGSKKSFAMLCLLGAFFIWGLVPLYFDLLHFLPETDLICYRVIFSFLLITLYLFITHSPRSVIQAISTNKNYRFCILSSLMTLANWTVYVYSVRAGCVLQGSLAYYIVPIVTILFGLFLFREKISKVQSFSIAVAAIGVLLMILSSPVFPHYSFLIAITFSLYTLIRKKSNLNPFIGLWVEMLILLPIVTIALFYFWAMRGWDPVVDFTNPYELFILANVGTVSFFPLLLFTIGIKRIKMTMVGALQYITPTCQFLLGILVYNEAFNHDNLIAYCFIWGAVLIFIASEFLQKKTTDAS